MTERYWFKTHKAGIGWRPIAWQGWLAVILYLIAIVYSFVEVDRASHSVSDTLFNFLPRLFIFSALFIIVSYLKGEPVINNE